VTYESWLSTWPHALVAGTTGSGKTTFMRSLLGQLNFIGSAYSQVVVVDGKGETDYFGVLDDSMFVPEFDEPLLEIDKAVEVLAWLKDVEVPRRKELIRELAKKKGSRVDAKSLYIEAVASGETPIMSPLVVVIDEFNELMIRGGNAKASFIDSVTSVAQAARSVLVHLILATQRPDRTVVPGTIKANLPGRIAFRLPTATDSITVLGHGGAEKLLGWGDMLFQLNGEEDRRLQSFIMND
jgi:S-DNA-T family DNA segregation ATPase FtsK/SpoIIIE